eukprot:187746_1
MHNIQSTTMQITNLCVLILLLTRWISPIHGQVAPLSWQIYSCQLFYDRSNENINTDNSNVCGNSPPMPCNCNDPVEYRDPLQDGSAATTLHLTDNSYLHYTIRLVRPNDEYWAVAQGATG